MRNDYKDHTYKYLCRCYYINIIDFLVLVNDNVLNIYLCLKLLVKFLSLKF